MSNRKKELSETVIKENGHRLEKCRETQFPGHQKFPVPAVKGLKDASKLRKNVLKTLKN